VVPVIAPSIPILRARRDGVARFLVRAVVVTGLLYGVLYFPYRSENVVVRGLEGYLCALARLAGGVIALFDATAGTRGTVIEGRFPLQIVLDCSAADAQALFVGAVLAFPAGWRRKALGAAAGVVGLNLVNLARIVLLYFVGASWPRAFHILHEEVIQLVFVLIAAGAFAVWARWARAGAPPSPQASAGEV
jgi:exosortase/archaeosortase family protein